MLCYVNYIQSHSIAVNSKYQVSSIYAVPVSMSLASLSRCVARSLGLCLDSVDLMDVVALFSCWDSVDP